MSIEKIEKINFSYPKGTLQSVYDTEEMTALELAAKTSKKVDECVDMVNGVKQTAIDATAIVDEMRIAQDQFMIDNIDYIKQDVNTKVDALINDGTIESLINDTIIGGVNDRITSNELALQEVAGSGVINGLEVLQQSSPNMTVLIAPGVAHLFNGKRYSLLENATAAIDAPNPLYPRIDIIYINSSGVLTYGKGEAASNPIAPTPVSGLTLAEIYVDKTDTIVVDTMITDKRKMKNNIEGLSSIVGSHEVKLDAHTSQLAQTAQKTGWVDPIAFGCIGDGVADDIVPLQQAVNYAQENKIPLRDNGNHIFNLSAPLYVTDNLDADFNHSVLRKTTNEKGVGSFTNTGRGVTYTFTVDAIIIGNKQGTIYENHLKKIKFDSTAPNKHEYGVYMPHLAKSTMEDLLFQWSKFDYGVYGYVWWIIPKFNNIRLDDGIATWKIADDGSSMGGSTSIKASLIIGTEQTSALQLYGVSYSVINIPLIDNNQPKTSDYAFEFLMCEGITVNSPSVEMLRTGKFLRAQGAKLVINTPRADQIHGVTSGEVYLIDIDAESSVTINNGMFKDYESGNSTNNFPLIIRGNSHVILNNTILPNNGNQHRGLTNSSTLITNNSKTGITFQDSEGAIDKNNGRRTFFRDAVPTEGDFILGDKIILNKNDYRGRPMEYTCVWGGNPGTWRLTKQGGIGEGYTAYRPAALTAFDVGLEFYDMTMNKFIKWNGTDWKDSEGNTV